MDIKVTKGQSLWKIAKAHKPPGVTTAQFVERIIAANDFDDPDELQIGDIVTLPDVAEPPTPKSRPGAEAPPRQTFDDGTIDALPGPEVLGPAGNAFDRQHFLDRAAVAEEQQRRAQLHAARRRRGGQTYTRPEVLDERLTLPPPRPAWVAQGMALGSAPDRGDYTLGDPKGLLEEGNINLAQRKRVDNGDGTFSTIVSKSFEEDGVEVLIPTLGPNGEELSDDEALQRYRDTGEHLGKFRSPDQATAYAQRLSLGMGTPHHDPDAYIDLGSPRWKEVFGEGMYEARKSNLFRNTPKAEPGPARSRGTIVPTPKPRPERAMRTVSPEARRAAVETLKKGLPEPTFQPTKAKP